MRNKETTKQNIPDGWREVCFEDVLSFERPDNYIVKSTNYSQNNKIPVLTANKAFVLGYTAEDFDIYKKNPVIIFDDFTTDSKYVDFPFKVKSSAIKILKSKDKKQAKLKFLYEKIKSINFPRGAHKRYYISQYQKQKIALPPIKEQQKIAEILGAVDDDIAKTQEVIDATEKLKKGLMQQLFSKSNVKDKRWGIVKLQDVCKVRQGLQIPIKKRFKEGGENRFIYITLKYLKALDNVEYIENPSKSVICGKEDILMTRTGNTGIVVTNVSGVFHNNFFLVDFDREKIVKDFLVYYLRSGKIQKIILDRAGTTTIPDLNHGDFYSINFVMPSIKEQQKIAEILSAIDKKISVNKKLKAKLTQLKKGLMQDLLSGRVRTNI